ncbi:Protein SUPPRESSOR OF QUENCHING 1, chloroplastic, partial [Mucuna pruriens]
MHMPSAQKPIANWTQLRGFCEHRILTMADKLHEPATEIDLLSFIKASLDEFEGTHHYWLNRSDKNDQLSGANGIFFVLAARIFDCGIMLEKLKTIQKRFPHINIMGLKTSHSSADQVDLIQLLMTENITFPILLSQQTFPKIDKGACYILFKNFTSPVIYHEKDVDLENLSQAIRELQVQPSGDSKSLNVVRCTSLKPDEITKDQCSFSPLQNLLLYYPGCVSTDESDNRLFFSDCNHHRILVSDGNGEILDCIGSSPGFEDGDFESAKLRRPAGSYYHATEDCLYFVDSENHAIRKADMGARIVETLYPTSTSNKGGIPIWNWIMRKLGLESSGKTNVEERTEVFDSKSLYFPWHLLKSVDDTLYIIDR